MLLRSLSSPEWQQKKFQWRSQDMSFDLKQASRVTLALVLAIFFAVPKTWQKPRATW
jgi:hypothetical protein